MPPIRPPDAAPTVIRPASPADAEELIALLVRLDEETPFMMYDPGERSTDAEPMRGRLLAIEGADNQVLLLAEEAGRVVGFLAALGGSCRRTRHRALVALGVRQARARRGVATRLLREAEQWAARVGVNRLELTVMTHNEPAIALYRKLGYQQEGVRRRSMWVEERWVDELTMARLLPIG